MAQDSITSDIVSANTDRTADHRKALEARLEALVQSESPQPQQQPQQGTSAPPVPAGLQAPSTKDPSFTSESVRAIGGSIRDAAQNTLDLVHDAGTWLGKHLLQLRMDSSRIELPKVPENQTMVGKGTRSILQFVIPFVGATKFLKAVRPTTGVVTRAMTAGAATDFAAFDPHEKRLSNMVMEMSDNDPAVGKEIFEYLAADPNDTTAEGRFKNALEGMGIGLAVEGIFKGLRVIKNHYTTKGQDPAEAVQKAAEAAKKEADEVALKAEADKANLELDAAAKAKAEAQAMPLVDQINAITGVKKSGPDYQKRLDVLAATKGEPKIPNSTPPVTKVPHQEPLVAQFKAAEKAVKDGAARRVILDVDGGITLTKDAPKAAEVDLGTRVKLILEQPAATRSPEDLVALRAYRQLQESAFPGIVKAGDEAPKATNGKPLEVVTSRARKGDAAAATKATPDADEVVEGIKSNNAKIAAIVGATGAALVSPAALAQMATPAIGAAAGAASADEDDDFATMLSLAGIGALAAYGIKVKVGNKKVLTAAEREVAKKPHPVVQSLARKEVANIAPVSAASVKRPPVIKQALVSQIVKAAIAGDYASVTKALKESDFNFAHVDSKEDIQRLMDAVSSVFEKEIATAKHGVQADSQLKDLAEETGAGLASLKKLYGDTDQLGSKIFAHRSLLAASAETVTSLSKLAMTGDAEAILALRKHVTLHASIQAQMKGVQTEVARALRQFRLTASSVDLAVNERNQLIEAMGGHKANMDFAKKLSDITDAKKLNAVVRKSAMARSKDALFEGWINGLLSSLGTHMVNGIGNSLTALNSIAERGTASLIGKVLRTDKAIESGEVKAQMFGMVEGLKDAVSITTEGLEAVRRSAGQVANGDLKGASATINENLSEFGGMWQAAAKDAPVLDSAAYATKEMHPPATTAENFNLDPNSIIGGVVDGLGALIRLPGRALTTSDELFKTVHYRGELKAQAYRIARGKGLEGDDLFTEIGRLIEDPTPELQAQAMNAARQGTFTNPLGSRGAALQNLVMNTPGARYAMPFIRTPINLMKFVGVRTPGLNMLAESVRNEFKAGGVRRDIMLAKTAIGGTMYALGAHLAAQGHITGGGEKDQSAERLGGIQPYSVKIGNTYYSFSRLDPFGMFLGLAADITEISGHISADEMDNVSSAAALALSRNLVSKQYLSGIVELLDTVNSGSEAKWQRWTQRMAGSFVPFSAGTASIRREVDPEVKEVWTMVDAIKARIPGLSKDVPPLVNIFGEDVHYKGGLGPDIASPVYTSEASTEPAAAEIARLNIDIRHPSKTILAVGGGPGIDLTPKQYYRYMKLIGNEAKSNGKGFKDAITEMVQSDFYKSLPEDPDNNLYPQAKEKVIRRMFENYQKLATGMLLQEDPQLKQAYELGAKNAGNALSGKPIFDIPMQQ